MKLAGGGRKLQAQMNQSDFLQQIRAYEDMDDSQLDRFYKLMITIPRDHPFPIMRAKHLDEWAGSGYRDLTGPAGLLGDGQ